MEKHIKIFIAYAHEDRALLRRLEKHLAVLRQKRLISTWNDSDICAGTWWKHEIDIHLDEADVILLLISAAFLASEYCYSVEMTRALDKQQRGEAYVIPIILSDVDWKDTPFCHLQALPTEAKPVTGRGWQNQNEAFANVAQGIRKVVERLHLQESHAQRSNQEEKLEIKPGGVWVRPQHGARVKDILQLAAYVYPTHPGDPAIDHVNFTIGWNGYWQVASVAYPPATGALYSGNVDLRQLALPRGELRVSFDVYDQQGNANLAPQGKRMIRWIGAGERLPFDLPQRLRGILK